MLDNIDTTLQNNDSTILFLFSVCCLFLFLFPVLINIGTYTQPRSISRLGLIPVRSGQSRSIRDKALQNKLPRIANALLPTFPHSKSGSARGHVPLSAPLVHDAPFSSDDSLLRFDLSEALLQKRIQRGQEGCACERVCCL